MVRKKAFSTLILLFAFLTQGFGQTRYDLHSSSHVWSDFWTEANSNATIQGLSATGTSQFSNSLLNTGTGAGQVPLLDGSGHVPASAVPISSANVLFVAANGNDATGPVGDPTHPWATVTSGTSLTVTLAALDPDQQKFDELLTLLNTAPMPPTLTIADIHGNPLTITVPQYYTLIGSYGQQIAGLWTALATAKSSVAAVTGTAGLSKITLADPTGQ